MEESSLVISDPIAFLRARGVTVLPSTPGATVPATLLRQSLDSFRLHRGNLGDAKPAEY